MLETLGSRQKQLIRLLLKGKAGMTADELSVELGITRNAVRQHLAEACVVRRGRKETAAGREVPWRLDRIRHRRHRKVYGHCGPRPFRSLRKALCPNRTPARTRR